MFNRITHIIAIAALLASVAAAAACSGSNEEGQATTTPAPTAAPVAATSSTSSPSTTAAPTTTLTTAPDPGWIRPPVCDGPCPKVQVLFTVPVGGDGVGYANIDREETVGSGPGAFAVDEADRVWIIDEVNRRLLGFTLDGTPVTMVDLTTYEVASAVDIAASPDGLLLLDIDVATQRYRVLQLDEDGELEATYELPTGVRLEDGLTGIAVSPEGRPWLELEFGNRVAELRLTGESVEFSLTPGYPYPAGLYGPSPGDTFAYQAADVEVTVATDRDLGGLSWVGLNPDGSFVLKLDEVYADDTGVFQVDETVHLFDVTGIHLGEAVFPLADQFIEVFHALALGPDGNTYALLTRPDNIAVALLPYSR